MKKIYLPLSALLLSASLLAQTPANRTAQTTVADVLAQLPAARANQYNKLIEDLSGTGEAGILYMVSLMNPPGKGSNAQVDYALSGLSHFATGEGKESLRTTVANAYMKALGATSDEETKKFIIRQIQIVGQDESVDPLAANLADASLSGPSARALASIGTPKAVTALRTSLLQGNLQGDALKNVILAIGESAIPDAAYEPALMQSLNAGDEATRKAAYYTLGKVGTVSSLKTLSQAAEKAGYKMDKQGTTEAYILLLKNLAANGQAKEAEKSANDLLKKATKANQTHARTAALNILLSIQKENGLKLVTAAMKDGNKEYRNAALDFTSCFASQPVYVELMKTAVKAKPEVKVDIVNWLGREATCPEKNPVLRNLEIRFDQPARDALLKMANEPDFQVKQAAVWTLVKIGDPTNIPEIARLLTSNDPQTVLLAQDALMAYKGDIAPAVARVIPQATDGGKRAGVELLAHRKASANLNTVLELIRSGSPEVKQAAYKALKDVVAEKDLTQIAGMLETADQENVPALQEAVISSLNTLSPADQVRTVSRRMVEAGNTKKYLYYSVLAATGEAEALPTIVEGFNSSDAVAKEAAFEALLRWRGVEVADELYNIAAQSSSQNYSNRALDRYIILVSNPSITGENRLLSLRKAMDIARTDAQKNQILQRVQRTGTYLGLLYAGEFLDQKPLQQSAANAVMNIALENKEYTGRNVRELLNKVIQVLDNPDADYQRQAIRKHLAEMPDEEGYVSLFNGKDLSGWKGLVANPIARSKMSSGQLVAAQEKADEQMRRDWKVENGLLVFDGTGYDNLCTVKQYGDFEMYVDWKLDADGPEPDGGIYLRGTPQVQFWDISRTNVGAQVGSGGLYNNQTHPSDPLKVADNKLGEWNTFYIKMVGDRVTVKLNGELVTDDVILENYWDRKQPIFPVEQIELQAHGSKVYYRNIYVKELERPEPFQLSEDEKKEGYKILFDGTNMHQWVGNTVDYTMEDGTISMIPSRSFGGNLYTKEEYGNFIFRFEFQLTPAANNGLGIRTPMEGDAAYVGMELQILDSEHPVYKDLHDYQYHGSVYGIIPAKRGYLKPLGEWNYQEVIANGDHIKITLNGEVILDGNIREAVKNGTPDGKEHPGLFNKKGHIGFLGHGSPVKFRNIRIKELK